MVKWSEDYWILWGCLVIFRFIYICICMLLFEVDGNEDNGVVGNIGEEGV